MVIDNLKRVFRAPRLAVSRPLPPPCSRAVVAATASDAPPLQKTKCCFCNVSIERGKEHKLPLDDNGEARLPPDCARRAAAKGAAATGWLHNQAGKSCYNVVCKERSALREKARPTTRNGYEPGSAMPHVAAARAPKQDMLVGDVNFDGESPLGLLLVQTPRRAPDDSAVILVTPL